MKDRRKSSFGFRATAVLLPLVALVAYALSIGPTWWLIGRVESSAAISPGTGEAFYFCCRIVYAPLTYAIQCSPKPVQDSFDAYLALWR